MASQGPLKAVFKGAQTLGKQGSRAVTARQQDMAEHLDDDVQRIQQTYGPLQTVAFLVAKPHCITRIPENA